MAMHARPTSSSSIRQRESITIPPGEDPDAIVFLYVHFQGILLFIVQNYNAECWDVDGVTPVIVASRNRQLSGISQVR